MKACPECAESIQDAARKCRFCGYRYDAPDGIDVAPSATPADAGALPLPAVTPAPAWPFALVAFGGALLALGGVSLAVGYVAQARVGELVIGSMAFAGVLLAVGWGMLLPRREAGVGAVVGGLLLAAGALGTFAFPGNDVSDTMFRGLVFNLGLAVCAIMHLGTLELLSLDGARLAAYAAIAGIGGSLLAFAKQIPLSEGVQVALMWLGFVGTVLFGLAIAAGASSCWRAAKP
jgi:hypothetical protein